MGSSVRDILRGIGRVFGAVFRWLAGMPYSLAGFLLGFALSILGMGLLGLVLYYPVAPVLGLRFGSLDEMPTGDWFWPTLIVAGMLWSFGFLVAGQIHRWQVRAGGSRLMRVLTYLLVLWLWDALAWWLALESAMPRF